MPCLYLQEMNKSDKYRDKFRIASSRLQSWDYGKNAEYHIVICTENRFSYFGQVVNEEMQLNDIGKLAEKFWCEIPLHFSFIKLDEYIIMPNHMHGIIIIDKPKESRDKACLVSTGKNRFQNQGKETLSSIIGSYKSAVTRFGRKIDSKFSWQSRFYEHIIRDRQDFLNTTDYIKSNPKNWINDEYFE